MALAHAVAATCRALGRIAVATLLCAVVVACDRDAPNAGREAPAAPEGQVVAVVNGQEITIHEVNAELVRSGVAELEDRTAQEMALQNIVRRVLFAQAAVAEKLDREPRVILNLEAARDAVLGEAYMMRELAAVAEPSLTEVDDYIATNPLMFTDRRSYIIRALSMAGDDYSEDLVPLFDETLDFTQLKKELDARNVAYDEVRAARLSTDFAPDVRAQLARLGVNDNLVVRTETSAQILKIEAETAVPIAFEQARAIARSLLLQERLRATTGTLEEGLRHTAEITYLGPFKELGERTMEAASDRMGPIEPSPGLDELTPPAAQEPLASPEGEGGRPAAAP